MGSMVSLGIGKLELDWGKDSFVRDHGSLFQPSDVGNVPYYYPGNVIEHKKGVKRKLALVKRRLDLLGYSLASLQEHYESHLSEVPGYIPDIPLSYDEFYSVVSNLDVSNITLDEQFDDEELEVDYDYGEFITTYLFKHPEFNKKHKLSEIVDTDIGLVFENMDPYITLRILAENPVNCELDVYWAYADIVDNGAVQKDELFNSAGSGPNILIVTEGSSDTHILKKAINILYSDISDFFTFVDMEENYPFTGDGNLTKFCKGLSSIRIKNNVLVIFDNDVAGVAKYNELKEMGLPENMHIVKLPDHSSFERFKTVGPHGESYENINGTAVAIECFLDHTYSDSNEPCVRWTSYNKSLDAYQGELLGKGKYTKKFLKLSKTDDNYNIENLKFLLDYLYSEWIGRNA